MNENVDLLVLADAEDIPKEPVIEITKEKSFNRCLTCEYLGPDCSGPNLNAMTVERACEFLQLRRMQLHFSYQKVADLTNLSLVTVKRILTGKIKDPSFLSMQALTYVLISDPKGKYPCAMHLLSKETNQAIADCQAAQATLAQKEKEFERDLESERRKVSHLKEQIKFNEIQMNIKDKIIEDRASFMKNKDRYIFILALLLGLSLAVIFSAMIVDAMNSSIDFFWRK